MPRPQPILVYSKYVSDLARFQRLLSAALPDVEIHYAGSAAEAAPQLERAQILYGWGFSADVLRRMPNLRWVQKMGAGVDDIIGNWPFGPEVVLTRTDGRLIGSRMVEYVIGAILDKTSKFDVARRLQADKRWDYFEVGSIEDLTVGVAGLGEIGAEIARVLRSLGADVIGWRRSRADCPSVRKVFAGTAELGRFVQECDVLVLVLPLTHETRNLFDKEVLSRCRAGAHLINVGRGAVLDENAALGALDTGRLAHATLDVFATEPLPHDHPFWSHPKITVTPHICGPLIPEKVVPHFLENYAAFAAGKPMQHVVDLGRQY
jgi:glyoxylate/hydroxypyruvate reductase A